MTFQPIFGIGKSSLSDIPIGWVYIFMVFDMIKMRLM